MSTTREDQTDLVAQPTQVAILERFAGRMGEQVTALAVFAPPIE